MEKLWKYSGNTPSFVLTALLIENSNLCRLAQRSIEEAENPKTFFRHISIYFGFMIYEEENLISIQSLENLMKYREFLSTRQLEDIAEQCQRSNYISWSEKNLKPYLGTFQRELIWKGSEPEVVDLRAKFFPNKKEIKEFFSTEKKRTHTSFFWSKNYEKRGIPKELFFQYLKEWLEENPGIDSLKFAAKYIEEQGTRINLEILNSFTPLVSSDAEEFVKIKEEAEFKVKRKSL